MAEFVGEVTKDPEYQFDFTQRDIDLLISILYDLTSGDGCLMFKSSRSKFVPNANTLEDLKRIQNALDEVGMSAENDYLSNFDDVLD